MLTTESLFVSSVLNKEDGVTPEAARSAQVTMPYYGVPGDKAPPGTFYLTPM